jgi:tetratricopeptide (TPR) repeat protein
MVSGLIEAGFVTPARGPRREYRFSFHDLVLLRAAQGLSEARLPAAKILLSLRRLRTQLPSQLPLAGLRIEAVGDAVVVTEGQAQWQPDDGQYVLRFQVESPQGKITFFDVDKTPAADSDDELFATATSLEDVDAEAACAAYRETLRVNPRHVAAHTNLGRLLHQLGRLAEAETVYRDGLAQCSADGTLLFNLAVLTEDLKRQHEAAELYRAALRVAPDLADAHFNLALLCDAQGLRQEAVRHLSAFRKLARTS